MRAKLTSLLMMLCLLMVFAAVVQAAPAGKVTNLDGRADLTAPGQPAKALFIGDAVNVGDILRTKSASKLEVTWIDGSIARLSENSRLKVTEFTLGAQKRSTILSLFRGKVQNIVTGTTKLFGAKDGSRYEVHTPTSVCGVRGTTFFTYHENGISGALFTEGQGFMYSKGQPDNVKPVAPGVLMTVTSANKPPEAKPAKPGDATKLFNATNPSEKKKDDKKGEDKKEGGTGGGTSGTGGTTSTSGKDESTGGTKTEDTGSTTTTTTTTGTTGTGETTSGTTGTMLGGDPTATLGTAAPGTLASKIETGTVADSPGTSSPLTNPTQGPQVVVPVNEQTPTFPSVSMETSTVSPTKSETATFVLSSNSTATPVTFEYNFNNVGWQAINGSTLTLNAPDLPEGSNSIIFRAKDKMGNLTPENSYAQKQWTVYYTNPVVSWTTTPPQETTSLNSPFSVQADRPDGHVNYSYTLDGENWINAGPLFAVTNGLKKDENNISLKATDIAGNSSTIDYSWYLTGLDLLQQFTLGGLSGTLATTPITLTEGEGTGTIELTASGTAGVTSMPISGSLTDGTVFNGYLAGIQGSWRGLFNTIYKKNSTIGLFRSDDLNDLSYSGGILNASGILTQKEIATTSDSEPQLFPLLPLLVLQNLAIGESFSDPIIRGPYQESGIATEGIKGYNTSSGAGGILGIWGAETTAGTYVNATGVKSENVYLYHYSYVPDPYAFPIDHFAFGSVTVTDDLAGHTTVSGTDSLTYLDRQYLGKLSLDYRGVYDYSPETSPSAGVGYSYSSVGTGIYNLQALSWSGDWGPNRNYAYHLPLSLYGNFYDEESQASFMELVAHETGLVGGVAPFWAGTSRLTALGYIVNDGDIPVAGEIVAGPLLWNSGIAAQATTGVAGEAEFLPDAEFTGVTAGVWKDGLMNGSAYAIYKTAAGQAGWLIGKDTLSGLYNSDLGVWKIEGDITPTPKFASLHPELTANLEIFHDIAFGITGGSYGGQGSILNEFSILQTTFYGTRISVYDEEYEQEVERILPLRWGIYDVMAGSGNSFSGKTAGASSWTAKVGGVGPTQMGAPFYYLADITGTWAADETISGQLAGTYMTPLYKGVLSGPFYGLYNIGGTDESGQYGGWVGQSVGTYNVTQKLDHSASWGGGSIFGYYADEGILLTDSSGRMNEVGYAAGLLGGTTAPWSGATAMSAMGLFSVYDDTESKRDSYLWNAFLQGRVPQEINETPSAGGIYEGYSAALWRTDNFTGAIRTIYLTPPDETGKSTAGFLTGSNLTGNIYALNQGSEYDERDYNYSVGLWESAGKLTASAPVVTGLDPATVTSSYGEVDGKISGSFAGVGALTNDMAYGDLLFFMNGPTPLTFGVYDLKLGDYPGGTFSGKPAGATAWSGNLGGALSLYNNVDQIYDSGYWIAGASGQWSADGEITGNVTNGKYLTTMQSGTLSGPFYGLYTEGETAGAGTWVGQSVGNYEGTPLQYASATIYTPITSTNRVYSGEYTYPEAYSGYNYSYNSDNTGSMYYYRNLEGGDYYTISYNADGTYSKYDYNTGVTTTGTWQDAEHPTLAFLQTPPDVSSATLQSKGDWVSPFANGSISQALLGGTDSIWNATSTSPAQATMMGQYIPGTSVPSLWNTTAYSYNYLNNTNTTYDGGAYHGWLAGTKLGNSGNANFLGLYINPTGDAGVVRGSLEGPFYPQTGLFVMDGGLYPEDPVVTGIGIAPENLNSSIAQTSDSSGMNLAAMLGTGGSIWTDNQTLETMFIVKESQGQPWGIYRQGFSGRFNPDERGQTTWSGQTGGAGTFGYYNDSINGATGDSGYWLADVDGTLVNSRLDGSLNGWYLTPIRSGDLYGNLSGVYEAKGNTWQATGLGTWSGAPLAYSARVFSGNWAYYNSTSGEEGLVNDDHPIAGLTGGLSPLFGSEADISGLGTYTRSESSPLFTMLLVNADGGPETNPFHLYYGGSRVAANEYYPEWFEGKMMGFYGRNWDGTKYNEIGLLTSGPLIDEYDRDSGFSVWGDLHPQIGMWEIVADEDQGTLTHLSKPGTASSLSIVESSEWSPVAKVDGDLQGTMRMKSAHIDGIENWGVWMSAMGGSYSGTLPERWASQIGWKETNASGKPSYSIADVDGYYYNDGALWGGISGRFINPDNMGVFTGDMVGITQSGNWQAMGIGSFDVTKTLAFSGSISGDIYKTAKGTLNINAYTMPAPYGYSVIEQGWEFETVYFRADSDLSGQNVKYGWQRESLRFPLIDHFSLTYYPNDSVQMFAVLNGVPIEGIGKTSTMPGPDFYTSPSTSTFVKLFGFDILTNEFPFSGTQPVDPASLQFAKVFSQEVEDFYATTRLIPDINNPLAKTFQGIMGGYVKDDDPDKSGRTLWNATDYPMGLAFMGEHVAFEGPATMTSSVESSTNGGAYYGFLTNQMSDDRDIRGTFYGLYISPAGNAGFLQSTDIEGGSYAGLDMWEAEGNITSKEVLSGIGVLPADLLAKDESGNYQNLKFGAMSGNVQFGGTSGNFVSGETAGGSIRKLAMDSGYTVSIKGYPCNGIFLTGGSGGTYANPQSADAWRADFAGYATFGGYPDFDDYGIWRMNVNEANSLWAANEIYAPVTGEFLSYTKQGTLTGIFIGNYAEMDSVAHSGIWGGNTSGVYEKTRSTAFSSGMTGSVFQNKLVKWISGTVEQESGYTSYYIFGDPDQFPTEKMHVHKTTGQSGIVTETRYDHQGYTDDANPIAYTKTTWQYSIGEGGGAENLTLRESKTISSAEYLADVEAMRIGATEYTGYRLDDDKFQGVFAGFNKNDDPSQNLWYNIAHNQPTEFALAGLYDVWNVKTPGVFMAGIASFDPAVEMSPLINSTSQIGGAYVARLGGVFGTKSVPYDTMEGLLSGLYYKDGAVGFLYGTFTGSNWVDIAYLKGSGTIDGGYRLGTGSSSGDYVLDSSNFASRVVVSPRDFSYNVDDVTVVSGDNLVLRSVTGGVARIDGNYLSEGGLWGISQIATAGTKEAGLAPSAWAWAAHNPSSGEYEYIGAQINSTANGISTGNFVGAVANYMSGITTVTAGDLKGLFDPNATTWQAISQGAFMETNTFLAKVASLDDAGKEAFMNATKIPAILAGSATLSQGAGTVNNLSNVTMNNVGFYAYSTGVAPKIWATNSVGGNYSGAPSTSGPAVLLSGNGLNATFNVNQWNGSTWSANVAGSGTLSGVNYNGPVQFTGGAAGTIQPAGTFSGTGAGIAK